MPVWSNINTRRLPWRGGRIPPWRAVVALLVAVSEFSTTSSSPSSLSSSLTPRGGSRGRTQRISISAPWPTSCLSPLAEAAEFVAESGDPSLFWKFVEAVGDAPAWVFACADGGESFDNEPSGGEDSGDEGREGVAAEALLEGAVTVAVRAAGQGFGREEHSGAAGEAAQQQDHRFTGMGMDDLSQRLMDLALSTRAHAPAIEAHRTLAAATASVCKRRTPQEQSRNSDNDHDAAATSPQAWAVVLPAGAVVCSPTELQASLRYPEYRSETVTCSTAATDDGIETSLEEPGAESTGAADMSSSLPCPEESSATADRTDSSSFSSIDTAFAFDHVYPTVGTNGAGGSNNGDGSRTITVVLYGAVGSPVMMSFHRILKEAVKTGCISETAAAAAEAEADGGNCIVRYVFRHALPYGSTSAEVASHDGGGGRSAGGSNRSRSVGDSNNTNNNGDDGKAFLAEDASASTRTTSTRTTLQGYGVVLDVKNMEYKNYDPSATPTEEHDGAGAGEGEGEAGEASAPNDGLSIVDGEEVGGVVLSTLVTRRPELRRELGMLRQALLLEEAGSGDGESEELKVWNMADLGIQALQSVASAERPLVRLEELSQNFPMQASALSTLKVQPGARDEVLAAQRCFFSELELRPSSLYVNGKRIDLGGPTFNAFQILSTLRAEAAQLGDLRRISAPIGALDGEGMRRILVESGPLVHPHSSSGARGGRRGTMSADESEPEWRVDVIGARKTATKTTKNKPSSTSKSSKKLKETRKRDKADIESSGVVWLNDIEKDAVYSMWSHSLQQLAYMSYQIPRVRRNMCNLVVVLDPNTLAGAQTMKILVSIVEQRIPVRVGLVMVPETGWNDADFDESSTGSDGGLADSDRAAVSAQTSEIAELVWRAARHAGKESAAKFVHSVAGALVEHLLPERDGGVSGGGGAGEGGGGEEQREEGDSIFTRAKLAKLFVKAVGTKTALTSTSAASEPWTEEGAVWSGKDEVGTGEDGRQSLPGARAMARLVKEKGLPLQSWSLNGVIKYNLGDIRSTLMHSIMQEHALIGYLYSQGHVSEKTQDVYSRVLKHSGAKVHGRFHPALVESPQDARLVDLSSAKALQLFNGARQGSHSSGSGAQQTLPVVWLHPTGTSDSAKGVSLVVVVDPFKREGLWSLEQALLMVVPSEARTASSGRERAGYTQVDNGDDIDDSDVSDNGDTDAIDGQEQSYVPLPPQAGLRLGFVFNPSYLLHSERNSPARLVPDGGDGEESTAWSDLEKGVEYVGMALPAVVHALRGKSPDKVPKFLVSLTREALFLFSTSSSSSSSPSSGERRSLDSDRVHHLAKAAGLSPSLCKELAAAWHASSLLLLPAAASDHGEASGVRNNRDKALVAYDRNAALVREVLALRPGESCALANGRRAPLVQGAGPPSLSDLSIIVDRANDLGELLVERALAWNWGAWPEGSEEAKDPDSVTAELQSDIIAKLASFLVRYHQGVRTLIPDQDSLSMMADRLSPSSSSSSSSSSRKDDPKTGTTSAGNPFPRSYLRLAADGDRQQQEQKRQHDEGLQGQGKEGRQDKGKGNDGRELVKEEQTEEQEEKETLLAPRGGGDDDSRQQVLENVKRDDRDEHEDADDRDEEAVLLERGEGASEAMAVEVERAGESWDGEREGGEGEGEREPREVGGMVVLPAAADEEVGVGRGGGGGGGSGVDVELVAVLDPLSLAAQRASTFLSVVQEVLGLPVTLVLTPTLEVAELPLKNFYRLVLGPASGNVALFERLPTRDILTQRLDTPEAWNVQASAALQDLDNLRCDAGGCGDNGTYITTAEYTLKGLLLSGRCYDVTQRSKPSPPQGLQLVLRTPSSTGMFHNKIDGDVENGAPVVESVEDYEREMLADTVVMNNLGYFQLQAQPGVWEVALAAGRASEVYELIDFDNTETNNSSNSSSSSSSAGQVKRGAGGIEGRGGSNSAALEVDRRLKALKEMPRDADFDGSLPATAGQVVTVRDFYSRYEPVLVRKQAGMTNVGVLQHDHDRPAPVPAPSARKNKNSAPAKKKKDGPTGSTAQPLTSSLWTNVGGMLGYGGGEGKEAGIVEKGSGGPKEDERVHVFSLATGHLYERFLKVMMLSVVKRCSIPVTFWLLENFLSSAFKESARAMAAELGFRVEFVTYKWPEWLRRQSEKQRIIWGYKILFLDVLFPLHVDKVIYVDADQVVRADLKELWDLDLEGAPYAYTPFCSSREETLGYQFWRGGFWQSHLGGKPYHISALYVVDLKEFRRTAVGDSLRAVYNALSADPHSLSNLDQDLPNYAQNDVRIFSLPQEWLWCESWCSDASKKHAKTIDLCNNPQHKEPKLEMAKRVISGPLFKESWVELDNEVREVEARRERHQEEQSCTQFATAATSAAIADLAATASSVETTKEEL